MRRRGAAVAAVIAQALAVVLVTMRPAHWPLAVAAHVVAAILLAASLRRERPDVRMFAFAVALTIPGLGLVALGALALRRAVAPMPTIATPSGRMELPEPDALLASEPVVAWIQRRLDVRPLADVVRAGDPASQLGAVRMLTQREDAGAVKLLRDALQTVSRDVQLAAAAGLHRIDDRLSARVTAAQAHTERAPGDAAGWRALGDAWRAYAATGLLPQPIVRRAVEDAHIAYGHALALHAMDVDAQDGLAWALMTLDHHGEAEPLLRERLAMAPTADVEAALATLLFGQRRWAELRDLSRASRAAGRASPTLAWWAG